MRIVFQVPYIGRRARETELMIKLPVFRKKCSYLYKYTHIHVYVHMFILVFLIIVKYSNVYTVSKLK